MGIVLLRSFSRGIFQTYIMPFTTWYWPISNALAPMVCQHKRITSIYYLYAMMHISILLALSKGLLNYISMPSTHPARSDVSVRHMYVAMYISILTRHCSAFGAWSIPERPRPIFAWASEFDQSRRSTPHKRHDIMVLVSVFARVSIHAHLLIK